MFGPPPDPPNNNNPGLPGMTQAPYAPGTVYTPAFQLPYWQQNREMLKQGLGQYQQEHQGIVGGRNELLDMLQAQARGEGPSVAQSQFRQATDDNLRQAMALSGSQSGYQPSGSAQRAYLNQASQIGQQAANQSGQLRAQETLAAREQLSGYLEGLEAINNQMIQYYTSQGLDLDSAQGAANIELQKTFSQNTSEFNNMVAGIGNSIRSAKAQKYAAPWGILSDETKKKDIKQDSGAYDKFLDTVGSIASQGPIKGLATTGLNAAATKAYEAGLGKLGMGLESASNIIGSGNIARGIIGEGLRAIPGKTGEVSRAILSTPDVGSGTSAIKGGLSAGGGDGGSSAAGGGVASSVAGVAGGLIGGRPGPADRQELVGIPETLYQMDSVYPSTKPVVSTNTGEIPQNKGVIGAVLSALSDVNMKQDVGSASSGISKFLDSGSSTRSVLPTPETMITPQYTAGLLETSDENQKNTVVDDDDEMMKRFLDELGAYSFNYKEPEVDGEGRHYSVMAQELEKTPVGKSMVQDTPRGKMIDYGKGFGVMLAAQSALHDRIKKLEGKGR